MTGILAQAAVTGISFDELFKWIFLGICGLCLFFLRGIYQDFKRITAMVRTHETDIVALDAALRAERRDNRVMRNSIHDFRDFLASQYAREWPAYAAKKRAERAAEPEDEDVPIVHRVKLVGGDNE
jgi:hypothetical protein